jgi:hypothetical protein
LLSTWQVPHARPLPLKVSLMKSLRPSATSFEIPLPGSPAPWDQSPVGRWDRRRIALAGAGGARRCWLIP